MLWLTQLSKPAISNKKMTVDSTAFTPRSFMNKLGTLFFLTILQLHKITNKTNYWRVIGLIQSACGLNVSGHCLLLLLYMLSQ